jgi:hypothetical protein
MKREMVGRVTPTILAMRAFEACFSKRRRISSTFPSSRDFPSTPLARAGVPIVRVCARRSTLPNLGEEAEQGNHNLFLQILLSLAMDALLAAC